MSKLKTLVQAVIYSSPARLVPRALIPFSRVDVPLAQKHNRLWGRESFLLSCELRPVNAVGALSVHFLA